MKNINQNIFLYVFFSSLFPLVFMQKLNRSLCENIKEEEINNVKIVVLGLAGSGKSSLVDALFGYETETNFTIGINSTILSTRGSFTTKYYCYQGGLFGNNNQQITIMDTPGVGSFDINEEEYNTRSLISNLKKIRYVNVFLITLKQQDNRLSNPLFEMFETFQIMFGKRFWKNVIIVVTHWKYDKTNIKIREKSIPPISEESWINQINSVFLKRWNISNVPVVFIDTKFDDSDKHECSKNEENQLKFIQIMKSLNLYYFHWIIYNPPRILKLTQEIDQLKKDRQIFFSNYLREVSEYETDFSNFKKYFKNVAIILKISLFIDFLFILIVLVPILCFCISKRNITENNSEDIVTNLYPTDINLNMDNSLPKHENLNMDNSLPKYENLNTDNLLPKYENLNMDNLLPKYENLNMDKPPEYEISIVNNQ